MSSSDGFCSTLSFAPGELGQIHTGSAASALSALPGNPSTPSSHVTPLPTPTHASSPIKPASSQANSGNSVQSISQAPPASPARSNSACSVATQSSNQQAGAVVNNPTPTLGSVPSVTATHSAQPSALPLTTPPQTPLPTPGSQGGTNMLTGTVLGKRDIRTASESEKEESKDPEAAPVQQPKKRRIAPTLVSASTDSASTSKDNAGNTETGG